MKDRLLARLRNKKVLAFSSASDKSQKGFTLIELLVVIAIIAILVVIVVVAINPVQRLNDASDRTAQSNVRSAGTLISTCITQELSVIGGTPDNCIVGNSVLASYGNSPSEVTSVLQGNIASGGSICASQLGSSGNYYVYRSLAGEVDGPQGAAATTTNCI